MGSFYKLITHYYIQNMSLKYYVKVITVAQYVTPHNKLGKLYATVSWLILPCKVVTFTVFTVQYQLNINT